MIHSASLHARPSVSTLRERIAKIPSKKQIDSYLEVLTKIGLNVNMINMPMALIESMINMLYPPVCVGCNRPNPVNKVNDYICHNCYFDIKRQVPPFCLKCGRGLQETKSIHRGVCVKCLDQHYYFRQAQSVCSYEGVIKNLIHKFKYNQKTQYREIFRDLFIEFFESFNMPSGTDFIVPIPLHPVRLREREYNQSEILAVIISRIIQRPVVRDLLFRRKNTRPQIDLDENKRRDNICGCFAVKNPERISSKSILLIDDVMTTGTTLSEAARALKEFSPKSVRALTLAS